MRFPSSSVWGSGETGLMSLEIDPQFPSNRRFYTCSGWKTGGGHDIQPEGAPVAASDAEIFDPATGAFRATGSLHQPRLMPAIVSTDDRVLVLGHQGPFDDHPAAGSSSEWFE